MAILRDIHALSLHALTPSPSNSEKSSRAKHRPTRCTDRSRTVLSERRHVVHAAVYVKASVVESRDCHGSEFVLE